MTDIVCFADRCINLAHVKSIIFERNKVTIHYINGDTSLLKENVRQSLIRALQIKGVVID